MSGADSQSIDDRPTAPIQADPGIAEGRSRIVLFVGMGGLGVGSLLQMAAVVWAGAVLVLVAFGLNTVGKLVHYRQLPIASDRQLALSVSWVLLAVSALGALGVFVSSRYGPRQGEFFWPLAVASIGFSLLHMAAQGSYLPEDEVDSDG